jgi:hypothetical protein
VRAGWIGQVRGETLRLEEHASWHRVAPQLHGQPKLAKRHTCGAQMRSDRQTVGTGAHDGNLDRIVHILAFRADSWVIAGG